jgi:hypothetical protein
MSEGPIALKVQNISWQHNANAPIGTKKGEEYNNKAFGKGQTGEEFILLRSNS